MNWKFWEPRPRVIASSAAREAMGITDPATQGFAAVAVAIGQGAVLNEPEPEPNPVQPEPVSEIVARANRLNHLREFGPKSEYHLEVAASMTASLETMESNLISEIAEHERTSAEKSALLAEGLADVRRVKAFYSKAPEFLSDPAPTPAEPAPKPKRAAKTPPA